MQRERIRRLAAQGWNDHDIARLTGLHVHEVRRAIAERHDRGGGG